MTTPEIPSRAEGTNSAPRQPKRSADSLAIRYVSPSVIWYPVPITPRAHPRRDNGIQLPTTRTHGVQPNDWQ